MTVKEAAELERHELIAQATRNHLDRIETESRRFRQEIEHIEQVYKLRTEGA